MPVRYDDLDDEGKREVDLMEMAVRRAILKFARPIIIVLVIVVILFVIFGILPALFIQK